MTHVRRTAAALVVLAIAVCAPAAHAEDIDLFVANQLQDPAAAPNLMILLDNSANWSREAQKWDGIDQGTAEMQSLRRLLASPVNANVGLGLYTSVGNPAKLGGYVRFGLRDMSGSSAGMANRAALSNILGLMQAGINESVEKVNDNTGEAAALYEMYKYYKGLTPFRGMRSSYTPNADEKNNLGSSAGRTAFGQGLTAGYAFKDNKDYVGPPSLSCGSNYVVFIINNAQGKIPEGAQTYEDGVSAGAALPPLDGVSYISWTDEWARFLYNNGVTVYILDAFKGQKNTEYSAVLERAAKVGGGAYFPVQSQQDVDLALAEILAQIHATNSNFAAASLPISATNRSQSLNQVFIGMFRPDDKPRPRWMGNLKQYQLARTSTGIDLVGLLPKLPGLDSGDVVDAGTGFVRDCAASFWTTDSASYWATVRDRDMARSNCATFPVLGGVTGSTWSDFPDGPTVEKGGVAEVLRKGPPKSDGTPTWLPSRTVLTYSSAAGSKLTPLTTSITGWSTTLDNWVKGVDDMDPAFTEFTDTVQTTTATTTATLPRSRPSIHGDVVHSRPLPVNYGAGGVTVYYGANDGMLRAVDAATGTERWAYVAPEHYAAYQRLHDNTPLVSYPNVTSTLNPQPKDYFFDGSFSLYQNLDSSKVWIFPSMRRGGRMLYAFDVTNPASPRIKWRIGCPNLADDTGCTHTDLLGIGQTWSMPNPAFLKGYSGYSDSTRIPILVVGGGYDRCEDADSTTTSCGSRKGNWVYVINADTGVVIRKFTDADAGSFAADITLSDANGDGSVDFGYAADTKGNIYRIDFSDSAHALAPLAEGDWRMRKVAYTTGGGRKFLYPPSLLGVGTSMYVALGSGNRERPLLSNYPFQSNVKDRFYVLLDDLTIPASSTTATAVNLDAAPMMDVSADTTCDGDGVAPGSAWKGWFMDLPNRGEQVVTSALIAAGMVAFNTNRPLPPDSSSNSCSAPLGEARGYWVSLANASGAIGSGTHSCGGIRSSPFVGGGLTPSPTLARVVIDGRTTTVAIGAANRDGGPSVTIDPQEVKPTIDSRRKTIYWKSNAAD
jgi:type IV pilus assembly protein PilY1